MPILPRQEMAPPPSNAYCAQSNKNEVLGVTGGMLTAAIVIVGLRTSVRGLMLKSVGADDYVMLTALAMAIGTFICFVSETNYAVGKHMPCVSPDDFMIFSKWQYYHSLMVMIGVVLVKISVALFLMRLVPPGKKWKNFLWASIVFLVCFCLTCMGTLIFSCVPIDASWNMSIRQKKSTHCFSNNTFAAIGLLNSSINCTTDFLFAIIPIPIIYKLQINRRTKITLGAILSLGYVACAAGIVKAVKQSQYFGEKDPLWHDDFNVWNMIELCIGIVAASLPALRPLFAKVLDKTKSVLTTRTWHGTKAATHSRTRPETSYRQQVSRDGFVMSDNIKLRDWKDVDISDDTNTDHSMMKSPFEDRRNSSHDERPPSQKQQRYTVCVTAGQDPGDDGSWEDIEPVRSNSEEARYPVAGIAKTTDMYTSVEHVEHAHF